MEKELLEADPSFVYDNFEVVLESEKGIFIEKDAETNTKGISVYIKELEQKISKKLIGVFSLIIPKCPCTMARYRGIREKTERL